MGLAKEALAAGIFQVLEASPEKDCPWSPKEPTYVAVWERPKWERSVWENPDDSEWFRESQTKYKDLDQFAVYALEAFREWVDGIRKSAIEMLSEADYYEETLKETDDDYQEIRDWIEGTRSDAATLIAGVCSYDKMLGKINYKRPPVWRKTDPNRLPDYF